MRTLCLHFRCDSLAHCNLSPSAPAATHLHQQNETRQDSSLFHILRWRCYKPCVVSACLFGRHSHVLILKPWEHLHLSNCDQLPVEARHLLSAEKQMLVKTMASWFFVCWAGSLQSCRQRVGCRGKKTAQGDPQRSCPLEIVTRKTRRWTCLHEPCAQTMMTKTPPCIAILSTSAELQRRRPLQRHGQEQQESLSFRQHILLKFTFLSVELYVYRAADKAAAAEEKKRHKKNLKVLSFGDDVEDDEEDLPPQAMRSAHDATIDAR